MKHLINALRPNNTPQIVKARSDQVQNNAGGFVFAVSDVQRFLRFLILGTEGGTFYATEMRQTKLETDFVRDFATLEGAAALEIILDVARYNRAPKPEPTLVALAAVAKLSVDSAVRKAAWDALPEVARTGTHLLHFLEFVQMFGGWGRLTRGGVAKLYETMPLEKLALWAVKYKSRDGWTQADALRLSHPKTADATRNALFKYLVDGVFESNDAALNMVRGHMLVLEAKSDKEAAAIMREYKLPIEAVPTHVRGAKVYRVALENNGLTWTLRNLGNLGKHELLVPGAWEIINSVVARVTDADALRKGRIHPIDALKAMLVYKGGRSIKGDGTWTVVPQIVDALEKAFYTSFGTVQNSGKRFVLGLDISGSMTCGNIAGIHGLTPNLASTAMAMLTARAEANSHIMGFSHSFRDVGICASDTLEAALKKTQNQSFGGTDCALPMLWALENGVEADVFVIYTDSETYFGKVHPLEALRRYRASMGIDARLVVVGMTATGFSIADPKDAGMMDIVGFDTNAPNIISSFARGEF